MALGAGVLISAVSYCNRRCGAIRNSDTPDGSTGNMGFRCVRVANIARIEAVDSPTRGPEESDLGRRHELARLRRAARNLRGRWRRHLGRWPVPLEGNRRPRRPLPPRRSGRRHAPPGPGGIVARACDHCIGGAQRGSRARDGKPAGWHRDADARAGPARRGLRPPAAAVSARRQHESPEPSWARDRAGHPRDHGWAPPRVDRDRPRQPDVAGDRRVLRARHDRDQPGSSGACGLDDCRRSPP
jgi:hypothetical protein